jgi:hypothetical protein
MVTTRFIPRGIRKRNVYLYLGNIKIIARKIGTLYCATKRSYVNHRRIGRILAAMAIRRIQYTPNTEFASVFDKRVSANAAIVPVIMNQILTGILYGGSKDILGETITISPFELDYLESFAYICSRAFVDDIEHLKGYAAAQGVAFVTVNPFTPFCHPAASIRLEVAEEEMKDIITLSKRFRVQTLALPLTPGSTELRATRYKELSLDDVVSGRITDEFRTEQIPDTVINGEPHVVTFLNPSSSIASKCDFFAYHIAAADDRIPTLACAAGVTFPMAISTGDRLLPDYLDLVLASRIAVSFEDQQEADELVICAFNKHSANVSVVKEVTDTGVTGNVDTRTGIQGIPANGIGGNAYPNRSPGQVNSKPFVTNQRDDANSEGQKNDGINRPNQPSGKRGGRRGGTQRKTGSREQTGS